MPSRAEKEKDRRGSLSFLGRESAAGVPVLKLGGREIFTDDLILLLLIVLLLQDGADPALIAALVYILAS